jgi:hypothetical protein
MDSLESLTAQLDKLSHFAETQAHTQPRVTRNRLTAETRSIFQKYAQHGNQARLRHQVKAFLETGDEGMTFAEAPPIPRSPADSAGALPCDEKVSRISQFWRGPEVGPVQPSRTVDSESAELVAPPPDGLDFHLDRSFVLNADTMIPQGLLESIDRVFGLYAKEAKLLLSHHCEKYGNEAVFRAGIREFIMR